MEHSRAPAALGQRADELGPPVLIAGRRGVAGAGPRAAAAARAAAAVRRRLGPLPTAAGRRGRAAPGRPAIVGRPLLSSPGSRPERWRGDIIKNRLACSRMGFFGQNIEPREGHCVHKWKVSRPSRTARKDCFTGSSGRVTVCTNRMSAARGAHRALRPPGGPPSGAAPAPGAPAAA